MSSCSPLSILVAISAIGFSAAAEPVVVEVDRTPIAQMARAEMAEVVTRDSGSRQVIRRSADGLFYLTAHVDRVPVRFIVDTGANVTVLSPADARRVAWRRDQLAGSGNLATASGNASVRWARVDQLKVAAHVMTRVDAVLPEGDSSVSLLGQNVLSQLGSVTQRGDSLIIS